MQNSRSSNISVFTFTCDKDLNGNHGTGEKSELNWPQQEQWVSSLTDCNGTKEKNKLDGPHRDQRQKFG